MIKLGMHVDNWRHCDVSYEVPCEFARDNNMEYVEFGTIDGDYFVQALGYNPHIPLHSDPLKLKKYLDSMGLKVSQLDAAYPMSCPEGQHRGIGYTTRAIQFAKALGCPCVDTTDGGRKPEGYTDDEVMALMKQYYRVVLEWAERYDMIINVEPHGPYTTNPDTMEQILNFSDSPYLRMNFDTGNSFIAGQDPVEFLRRFRHKVSHCHIKDVSKELAEAVRGGETGIAMSVVALGEGVNADNIAGCIELLKENNWDGVLSIECEAAPG
ncbi:MAG: sugar phosphate isomerase/epimerase family protein, partial [Planctomycetota bacterium]